MRALMDRKVGNELLELKGFIGVQGSGKNFRCTELEKQGYLKLSFADCLREMVWKMLDWQPATQEEYDFFKQGIYVIPKYGKINGRLLLQRVGETMREINPNFWVNQMKWKIENLISQGYTKFCFDDVRYVNEVRLLYSYGLKAVVDIEFCDYHSDRYNSTDNHESELLAQKLLSLGYKDGDKLPLHIFDNIDKI